MDNNEVKEETVELLKNIEQESIKQTEFAKKQYELSRISTGCLLGVLAIVLISALLIVPKTFTTLNSLNKVMTNIEGISTTLNEDLPELVENVNRLVGDEESGLISTIRTFNQFDVAGLNNAIDNLRIAIEPLAKLFGR